MLILELYSNQRFIKYHYINKDDDILSEIKKQKIYTQEIHNCVIDNMILKKYKKDCSNSINIKELNEYSLSTFLSSKGNKIEKKFVLQDLIGWNIKHGFAESNCKYITFEKDNIEKQIEVRHYSFEENFKYDKISYNNSNFYNGNFFETIEIFKDEVINITFSEKTLTIFTKKGYIKLYSSYSQQFSFTWINKIIPCSKVVRPTELFIETESLLGEKINFEVKSRNIVVASFYGRKTPQDKILFNKYLNSYSKILKRIVKLINETNEIDRLKPFVYESIESMISSFPEISLDNLEIDFKEVLDTYNEEKEAYKKREEQKKEIIFNKEQENNFSERFIINDTNFSAKAFVTLKENLSVEKIQIQLVIEDLYVQSSLDWKYDNKKYFFANIKTNSVHDKLSWNKASFDIIVNKMKSFIRNNFDAVINGDNYSTIYSLCYQLDYIKDNSFWASFNYIPKNKEKAYTLNEVPKDKLRQKY